MTDEFNEDDYPALTVLRRAIELGHHFVLCVEDPVRKSTARVSFLGGEAEHDSTDEARFLERFARAARQF